MLFNSYIDMQLKKYIFYIFSFQVFRLVIIHFVIK